MEFTAEEILARMKSDLKNEDSRIEGSFASDNLQAVSEELARISAMQIKPLWNEMEERIEETITSGNERHYEYWAMQTKDKNGVRLIGNARAKGERDGTGLVKIVCITPQGTAPSEEILQKVRAKIEEERPVGAKPIVSAGSLLEIRVFGKVKIYDGTELSSIKQQADSMIRTYLLELSMGRGRGDPILNYYRISSILSSVAGVKELIDCTINDGRSSIKGNFEQFFFLKEVVLNVTP